LSEVLACRVDAQVDGAAGGGRESVLQRRKVARDQRKQVRRLGMRVAPRRVVAAVRQRAARDELAVRQEHGAGPAIGAQRHCVACEHVRPIREIGDPAEPFRLALRAEHVRRQIQTFERDVLRRRDRRADRQRSCGGRVEEREAALVARDPGRRQTHTV